LWYDIGENPGKDNNPNEDYEGVWEFFHGSWSLGWFGGQQLSKKVAGYCFPLHYVVPTSYQMGYNTFKIRLFSEYLTKIKNK
jgi:hypothetical protein